MTAPTPTIPSFTDGQIVHDASLNALSANLTNLYTYTLGGFRMAPPFVICNQTVGRTVSSTETSMTFDTTVVSTDNMWSASVPNEIIIQTAGTYLFAAQVNFGIGAVNSWAYIGLTVNGTAAANRINTQAYTSTATAGTSVSGPTVATSCSYKLAAGATVFLRAASATSATTGVSNLLNTSLTALWISP